MQSSTDGLVEFLLARLAEDKALLDPFKKDIIGRIPPPDSYPGYRVRESNRPGDTQTIVVEPMRLFLECQARWEIIHTYQALERASRHAPELNSQALTWFTSALAQLAVPYMGHPDYRGEWSGGALL